MENDKHSTPHGGDAALQTSAPTDKHVPKQADEEESDWEDLDGKNYTDNISRVAVAFGDRS